MENEKYMPVGIIEFIDDETGEVIYKTHNMIVKSGRSLIMKSLFSDQDHVYWHKFYETGTYDLTKPESVYNENPEVTKIYINDENETDPNDIDNKDYDQLQYKLIYKFKPGNDYRIITAIGLAYSESESGSKKLFSRAAIDPVHLRPNRKYTAYYTIYF